MDGKWLRGVGNGQVKLLATMLHQEKVTAGQVRVPDGTTKTTVVKDLLRDVDLDGVVVTADAFHASRAYAGEGPQVMATLRNLAISLLRHAGRTRVTRTAQAINRNPARALNLIPL